MAQKSEFTVKNAYQYKQTSPPRWVWSHGWRYPLYVTGMIFFKLVGLIAYSAAPVFIGQAAQAIIHPETAAPNAIVIAAIKVLIALVGGDGLSQLAGSLSVEVVAQRLEADGREELYRSLLGKSQTFHDRQRVGDIMARATDDVKQLNQMINPAISMIYESVLAFLIPLIFIAMINPMLLLVPLVYVVVFILAVRDYTRRLDPVTTAQRSAYGAMNAGLEETVSGIETVKASAQEPFEREKFQGNAREYRNLFVRQGRIEAGYTPMLLYGIAFGLLILHAMTLYSAGTIQLADVIAVVGLYNVLAFPTFISLFSFSLTQLGMASAARILHILRAETDLDENKGGHSAPIKGDILFEDVSFGYEGSGFGVKDISFQIKPGQTVAIVGQTGSGKSTLTQLVNRTYDVDSGRILIDGVDVRDWDLDSLRSQISKIEQDVFLFSRTIAENIAFGRPDATREDIEQAAKEAQAHDFILSFEKGYETVIGERGVTLSGGQRQRIAIARALLTDPRILILDDSTSAIDSATEDEIQKAIQRARKGRTTLLITHRLSQIRWADTIIVMQHGTIIAKGTHDEMLRRSDLYRRIFARYDIDLPPLEVDPAAASTSLHGAPATGD